MTAKQAVFLWPFLIQKILGLMIAVIIFSVSIQLVKSPSEVVLIDAAIEHPEFFLQQLHGHQYPILLSPQSTLASVTDQLGHFSNLKAIHVISHGTPGQFQVGQTSITTATLTPDFANLRGTHQTSHSMLMAQWGQVLIPQGDIFLYGCEIATTTVGQDFLRTLHRVTQADIAASTDLSGDAHLNGNWDLETTIGAVASPLVLQGSYETVLKQIAVTSSADQGDGTLRWAIAQANLSPEDDLIELHDLDEPIVLRSPLPTLQSNVYLFGHGATVSGDEQFRVFRIQSSDVVIRNLTIVNGFARGIDGQGSAGGSAGLGGGLYIEDSGVILNQVRLINNRAEGGNGSRRSHFEPQDISGVIDHEKIRAKANRGAITGISGISLSSADDSTDAISEQRISPQRIGRQRIGPLKIKGTTEKFFANRGAIAGVNGIGVEGIGSIAFGGGGGFGGFGNAGNGGNGGNGGAAGGNGGNGGDGGDGGVGMFGSFGRWDADGGVGTIAFGGGGGFGGFGNAGNGGNGGNADLAMEPDHSEKHIANGGSGGNGGNGGFGGGGGGGGFGGQGGYGGQAGEPGNSGKGGFGGGDGELGYGGGGAGFGGAIFLKSSHLILNHAEFDQNVAIAGQGAHPGKGKGGAMFNLPGHDNQTSGAPVISLGARPTFQQNIAQDAHNTPEDNQDMFGSLTLLGDNPVEKDHHSNQRSRQH